jgi:hypothetical protein
MAKRLKIISLFLLVAVTTCAQFGRGFFPSSNGSQTFKANLVAYYPAEAISGPLVDVNGGKNMTEVGALDQTAGKVDFARAGTGTGFDDVFSRADDSSFEIGMGSMTWVFWVRPQYDGTEVLDTRFISKWDEPSEAEWVIGASGDALTLSVTTSGVSLERATFQTTGTIVVADIWHFCAIVFDNANDEVRMAMSATGTLAADQTFSGTGLDTIHTGTAPIVINGSSTSGTPEAWNETAGFDEVAIFNRALTRAEVEWIFNSGNGRRYSDY